MRTLAMTFAISFMSFSLKRGYSFTAVLWHVGHFLAKILKVGSQARSTINSVLQGKRLAEQTAISQYSTHQAVGYLSSPSAVLGIHALLRARGHTPHLALYQIHSSPVFLIKSLDLRNAASLAAHSSE